jgi:predicted DNA-binding antitoxin AbrB/MazE fold protein
MRLPRKDQDKKLKNRYNIGTVKQRSNPMKTEAIEAVYEHGSFRPVAPADLELAEGQKVRLVVEPIEDPDEVLALARRVYERLTDEQIDSIERHMTRAQVV